MIVGLLHPGAMGAFLGAGVRAAGHEVRWASAGRSAATRERATAAGLVDAGDLASLVADADVVLSVCPPEHAVEVARSVAACGFGGVYVDANAISVRSVREIAAVLGPGSVVDGAVVGGPSTDDARLHLCGEQALGIAAIFAADAVRTQLHDGPLGCASTIKACYAASTKAVTALLLAARAAARAGGVETELLAEWARTMPDVLERSDSSLERIGAKAWRFGGEMREAADVLSGLGVPDGFSVAAGAVFDRLADLRDVTYEPADVLARVARPPSGSSAAPG